MRPLPGSPPVGKLFEMTEIDIVFAHMIHGAVEYQRRGTPDVHVLISNSQNVVDRFTTPRTSRPRRPNYRRNSAERNPWTSPMVIRHGLQLLEHTSDGGRCQAGSEREGRDKKWSVCHLCVHAYYVYLRTSYYRPNSHVCKWDTSRNFSY